MIALCSQILSPPSFTTSFLYWKCRLNNSGGIVIFSVVSWCRSVWFFCHCFGWRRGGLSNSVLIIFFYLGSSHHSARTTKPCGSLFRETRFQAASSGSVLWPRTQVTTLLSNHWLILFYLKCNAFSMAMSIKSNCKWRWREKAIATWW